ncbi:MAG: antibiotic biosynthesis monooxygenase [Clostridiales bacterium]|nr:antibiotic biosynthesis monooxygenase [Clostridiales bacterium]
MLVINAVFRCKEGKRDEFLKAVKAEGIDIASRDEEGNFKYEFFVSAENGIEILLLEFWKDQDAHSFHRTLPHYLRLGELKEVFVDETIVSKYYTD